MALHTSPHDALRGAAGSAAAERERADHRFPLHVRALAYAYLVSVPFEIDFVLGDRSLTFWLAAALVFGVLVHLPRLAARRTVLNGKLLLPVVLVVGFGWLSYFWSIHPEATLTSSLILLSTAITWLVLAMVIADALGAALAAFVTGTTLMSALLVTSEVNIDGRADVVANVNDVAVLVALAAACLLAGVTRRHVDIGRRVAYALLLALHVWAMLATGSRGGALALLLTLVIVLAWSLVRLRLSLFVGVLVVVAVTVGVLVLLGVTLPERIVTLPSSLARNDLNLRDVIWRAALPGLPSVLGTGLGTTATFMSGALGIPAVMHSVYLGIAFELGVVGVILWSWMIIRMGAGIRTSVWSRELAMMSISLTIMAASLTLELRRPLWVFLAFLGALSIYAHDSRSRGAEHVG